MNILDQIIEVISEKLDIDQNLDIETELYSLDINSIQFILLLCEFENKFDIEIDIDDVDDFKAITIGDVIKIVEGAK